jgi:hypothetical protein
VVCVLNVHFGSETKYRISFEPTSPPILCKNLRPTSHQATLKRKYNNLISYRVRFRESFQLISSFDGHFEGFYRLLQASTVQPTRLNAARRKDGQGGRTPPCSLELNTFTRASTSCFNFLHNEKIIID